MPPSRRRARGNRNRNRGGGGGRGAYLAQTSGGRTTRDQDKKKKVFATGSDSSDGNRGAYIASTQGGKNTNKKNQSTGTSFGAAGQVGADQRLQMLVDQKDQLKNLPGGMGDDRNLYQVKMNEFKNRNALNRSAFANRFPISNFFTSGLPNILSKIMPGAGIISLMSKAFGKGKDMAGSAVDKVAGSGIMQDLTSAPGGFISDFKNMFGIGKKEGATTETAPQRAEPYDASGLEGYRDAIMRMNQTVPPISENFYGGRSPVDEAYAGLPSTKFGREFLERMGPRVDFNTAPNTNVMSGNATAPLNYNAPLVNRAALLSPTIEDFRENMAGTEPYEQPVLDFAMNRAPSSYNQTLEMLQNKYPGKSPMEYVGMMNQLQKTPNFQRTMAFNENFLPSANTPIQFADGGSVGNFNLLKATNDEMHG